MQTSDFAALRATPPTSATTATTGLSWQAASASAAPASAAPASAAPAFRQVFDGLQAEISQVIDQGWPSESALPALSAEGLYLRAGLRARPTAPGPEGEVSASRQDFLERIAPAAKEAGAALGVSAELVAAHAALESGWGQRPLRDAAGRDSHNLFGIKAQPGWAGARIQALTTEYEDGAALKRTEGFRSYPDYASAFRDYARLLQDNPRYSGALNTGTDASAFAQALARGGYATDPSYAAKLTRMATQLRSLD